MKFKGDRLKGLETADDCSDVEEVKRWNLQADILLFICCLLTAGHNQELPLLEHVILDIRDHTCLLGLQLV